MFTLINIFVAIILNSYDQVVADNPDANDSSQFVAMVLMQAKKTTVGAIAGGEEGGGGDQDTYEAKPQIMSKHVTHIDKEQYWDIFESYFDVSSTVVASVSLWRCRFLEHH